jgi:hypothetical protein
VACKQCPACDEHIDPDHEALGVYCCDTRMNRVESAQIGINTRRENGTEIYPLNTRLKIGFYMMDWSENWEKDCYQ